MPLELGILARSGSHFDPDTGADKIKMEPFSKLSKAVTVTDNLIYGV